MGVRGRLRGSAALILSTMSKTGFITRNSIQTTLSVEHHKKMNYLKINKIEMRLSIE